MTDWRGAPLLGIEDGRWQRGRLQDLAPGRTAGAGAVLLSEEGVSITPSGVEPGPPAELPSARSVLQSLDTFLRTRTGRAGFEPGRLVESADPADVPDFVGGTITSPAP